MRSVYFLFVATCWLASSSHGAVTFPRQSNAFAIWPMTSSHGRNDVSGKGYHGNGYQSSSIRYVSGPFGDSNTAIAPYSSGYYLFYRSSMPHLSASFTLSFFVKITTTATNYGLLAYGSSIDATKTLQVSYSYPSTIHVHANGIVIGSFTVLHHNVWTFVALVYDNTSGMFSIYGRHGQTYAASYQPDIRAAGTFNNQEFYIGNANRATGSNAMHYNDAVSCVAIYNVALTGSEIMDLHDACRAIMNSPPCGAPRLGGYTPIPSYTSTVPKTGQFPWSASLRFGALGHICSATIIDQYWVLTASSCFKESTSTSAYTVIVGEHDLNTTESFERSHVVARIVLSPKNGNVSRGELALVQVRDPIDITNQYVQTVCPYRGNAAELNYYENQFVFGWGANGRISLVPTSLPRYVNAKMFSDLQCNKMLPGEYFPNQHYCYEGNNPDMNVPCSKDEGAAMLMPTNDFSSSTGIGTHFVQVGVFVSRESECSAITPGIFAKVESYYSWISSTITCAVPSASLYPASCPMKATSPCSC